VTEAWDRYLNGETSQLTDAQKQGALLFYGRAGCSVCHSGIMLSDFRFHSLGIPSHGYGFNGKGLDRGRFRVTKNSDDLFRFRTPPLRNVTKTGPYFHNGVETSLRNAITLHFDPYRNANRYQPDGSFTLSADQTQSISLLLPSQDGITNQDVDNLLTFLSALESEQVLDTEILIPPELPSGLSTAERE